MSSVSGGSSNTATGLTANPAASASSSIAQPHVAEDVGAALQVYNDNLASIKEKLSKLGNQSDTRSVNTRQIFTQQARGIEDTIATLKNYETQLNSAMDATALTKMHSGVENLTRSFGRAGGGALTLGQSIAAALTDSTKLFNGLGDVASSSGGIIAAKMGKSVVDNLPNALGALRDIQTNILAFNRSALDIGTSFGKGFGQAADNIGSFRQSYINTMREFKASRETLIGIRTAFSTALDVTAQTTPIDNLSQAVDGARVAMNAQNVALLVAAGTGTDASVVAGLMAQSYKDLGENVSGAALALGRIALAAKGSNLPFSEVAKTIMDGASNLKMWGGTVASVAPLFKMFSDSLSSYTGRQGLTPELFRSFVGGIERMQFATRALFGMQLPSMAGKSALGAGLEMEKAMEDKTGEGMGKITESITASLKQFGGGAIITRDQAIADPALENNFLIQRQLLMQQMGLDAATANRTLAALQQIDQNGLASSAGAEDALSAALDTGSRVQQSTVGLKERAGQLDEMAEQAGGTKLINAISGLGSPFGRLAAALEKMIPALMAKGSITLADLTAVGANIKSSVSAQPATPAIRGKKKTPSATSVVAGTPAVPATTPSAQQPFLAQTVQQPGQPAPVIQTPTMPGPTQGPTVAPSTVPKISIGAASGLPREPTEQLAPVQPTATIAQKITQPHAPPQPSALREMTTQAPAQNFLRSRAIAKVARMQESVARALAPAITIAQATAPAAAAITASTSAVSTARAATVAPATSPAQRQHIDVQKAFDIKVNMTAKVEGTKVTIDLLPIIRDLHVAGDE